MKKAVLHVGQTDFVLSVKIDYENSTQITDAELAVAQSLEILYAYKNYDGENVAEAIWECDGYRFEDGAPYIYYTFKVEDAVPEEVDTLVGRAKIVDQEGLISYGRQFTIQVLESSL